MANLQQEYDDAMLAFSRSDYDAAIARLEAILGREPAHFEAQLALGMAFCRKGDYARAITEGLKAEKLRPGEQLAHTNLSLFYMRAGDRATAEHHALQARIASWKEGVQKARAGGPALPPADPALRLARPKLEPVKIPSKFPDMPWKKKPPGG